jgi:hypothetical protein
MGGLSPALYRLICTGPPCRNITNIDARLPRLHLFSPNFSSQYLCSQASYQKLVKAKSDDHHHPISVFLLLTSIRRASQRSSVWAKKCPKWGRGEGEGGAPCHTSFSYLDNHGRRQGKHVAGDGSHTHDNSTDPVCRGGYFWLAYRE